MWYQHKRWSFSAAGLPLLGSMLTRSSQCHLAMIGFDGQLALFGCWVEVDTIGTRLYTSKKKKKGFASVSCTDGGKRIAVFLLFWNTYEYVKFGRNSVTAEVILIAMSWSWVNVTTGIRTLELFIWYFSRSDPWRRTDHWRRGSVGWVCGLILGNQQFIL